MNAGKDRRSKAKAMDNGSLTEKPMVNDFVAWWSPRKILERGVDEDSSADFSQSVTTNTDALSLGCSPDRIESHPLYAVIEEYMIRDPRVRAVIEGLNIDDEEESAETRDDGTYTNGSSIDDESSTSYDDETSAGSSILESIYATPKSKVASKLRSEPTEDAPTTIYMSSQQRAASPLGLTPSIISTGYALSSVQHKQDKASRGLKKTRWPTFGKYRPKEKIKTRAGQVDDTEATKHLKITPGMHLPTSIESSKPEMLKTVTSQDSVADFMRSLILEEETEIVFDKSQEGDESPSHLWGNVKIWGKGRDRSPENKKKPQRPSDRIMNVARSESTAAVNHSSRALKKEPNSDKDETISSLQSSTTSSKYCRLKEKHRSVLDILATPSVASVDLSLLADPSHAMRKLQALKKRNRSIREILAMPSDESIPVDPESAEKEYEKLKAKLRSIRSILASPSNQPGDFSKSVQGFPRQPSSQTGDDNPTSSKKTEKKEKIEETMCSKKHTSTAKSLKKRLSKGKDSAKSSSKKVLLPRALETPEASNATPQIKNSTLQVSNIVDSENRQRALGIVGEGDVLQRNRDAKSDQKAKQKRVGLALAHKSRQSFDMKSLLSEKTTDTLDLKRCQESVDATGVEVAVGSLNKSGVDSAASHSQSNKVDCKKVSNNGHNRAGSDRLKQKTQDEQKAAAGVKQKVFGINNSVAIVDQAKLGNRQCQKNDSKEEKKDKPEKKDTVSEECAKKDCRESEGGPKPCYKTNLTSKVRAILPVQSKLDLELELRSSSLSNEEIQKPTELAVPSNVKNDAVDEVAETTAQNRSITTHGKKKDKDGENPKAARASAPAGPADKTVFQKTSKFAKPEREKVESHTDPTADASLVAEVIKEMNAIETTTEPVDQISGKASLSIYRFLDFNPCHSELPASPRSRRAANVVIKGLCSADNNVVKKIPESNPCRPEIVAPKSRPHFSLAPSKLGWKKREVRASSQGDETPRATNRNFVGNPCGDEQSDLNIFPQPDNSRENFLSNNHIRNAFECSEGQTSDPGASQNRIREVLYCGMDPTQTDVQPSKSNCSKTSKTSVVTFKEGLIDDTPQRSRSDGLSTSKGSRKPSALRRRLKHGKQSDDICEESIEMLDNFSDVFDEVGGNPRQSTEVSKQQQADDSPNRMTLVQKMKQSLRRSPNGSHAPATNSFPRDSSDVCGDSEVRLFIRTASGPSVRSASQAISQNRLATIRDEYTNARSMASDSGNAAGDMGSRDKISDIREEYKKARMVLSQKDIESPSIASPMSLHSADSEQLNEAEKAVARRLANDLMILSKIARKRNTRRLDTETKAKDIGRNMELVERHEVDDDSCSDDGTETEGAGSTPTTPFSMAGMFDWLLIPDKSGK